MIKLAEQVGVRWYRNKEQEEQKMMLRFLA